MRTGRRTERCCLTGARQDETAGPTDKESTILPAAWDRKYPKLRKDRDMRGATGRGDFQNTKWDRGTVSEADGGFCVTG